MAPIRYSLHYEDYSEHLMSRFGKLLQMQSLVDMTLMCSSHTLRVHKAVLAASSAYFQEVLQKQTGEPLIILKMRFSVLKSLVEFMYCGKTQCLEENLDELVSAAQFLKIKGLSKVTKEGLGIANNSELPVFTPPVVINRPPQSLIDLHNQESNDPKPPPPQLTSTSSSQPVDTLGRVNKDMVVRIPFDIEKGGGSGDYPDAPRALKPRRGRPSVRRSAWEPAAGGLGRAAERALLRREQDSRKAIHHLKHLQTRYNQDYLDRVTLSQAVNSICGPESSTSSYMNIDNDFMYMDQAVSSNVLDPTISYNKEHTVGSETVTSSYPTPSTSAVNESANSSIGSAMSQYVNALKSAGLPTDLPILFESGDGSYINVNEQVLLDMVQSNEIQYEVIEQPNIIENVSNPSEIKSIDDLSKSIERGGMMMNPKSFASMSNFGKDSSQFRHEDAINSLNAILPDNLDSFVEQQSYVVLDPRLQESNSTIDHNNDFSCIDGDMQFFTKSMSDDVKKYYEGQQLDDPRVMDQLCPTSTSLDPSFSISLLDSKNSHLENGTMGQQFSSLNSEDLRRNDDCYDFGLQLAQSSHFKEDALDCLMSTPKQTDEDSNKLYNDNAAQEREQIIKDLMNIEKNMTQNNSADNIIEGSVSNDGAQNFTENTLTSEIFSGENNVTQESTSKNDSDELSATITSSGIEWDNIDTTSKQNIIEDYKNDTQIDKSNDHETFKIHENFMNQLDSEASFKMDVTKQPTVLDLTKPDKWDRLDHDVMKDKWDSADQNMTKPDQWDSADTVHSQENCKDNKNTDSTLDDDIPYAVGLLPLKQVQSTDEHSLLKRKNEFDLNMLDNDDAKRKVKHKIL